MASGDRRKPSTTKSNHARACAGLVALFLGTTAITAPPAHADTSGTTGSISTNSDPRQAALAKAASTGAPVTVDSLTTADSTTQALPDGTFATTTTLQPTRMKNSAGAWENIDPTLKKNPDGTISTTATPNALTLSGGGTGPAITAADQAGHSFALSLPATLPTPTLHGASATYSQIYPGISLTVTAQPSGGFSEVFKIDDAAAETRAQKLAFTTHFNGLSLSRAHDGSMHLTDTTTGQTVMSAAPAVMWDSATTGNPAAGVSDEFETTTNPTSGPTGPGSRAHTGTLPTTNTAGTLALEGASTNLDTAAPTYPLYLDPTWTEPYQSGGTQHYDEVEGASACQGYQNYDNVTQPGVGDVTTNTSCPGPYETYFQLNTSNVLDPSYDIKSATLKINEVYSALNSCGEGSETISIYTTGPIGQNTDWSNKPGRGSLITSKSLKSVGNGYGTMCSGNVVPGDFNVLAGIQQARTNNWPNWTFVMAGNETSGSNSLERFNNNPSITTVYDIAPATPTNTAATPAPVDSTGAVTQGCDGNIDGYLGVTSLGGQHVATLSAKLTSAVPAAQMYGHFEFYDHTTSTEWFINSSGYVTSGATVSVQTPTLTDGHLYTWQVNSNDQYDASPIAHYCGFIVDQTAPNNPSVASSDFPPLGSTATTTKRYGQSGNNSGTLTLTSTDPSPATGTASGLKGFYYSLDEPATTSSTYVAASSGSASITIAPTHWGTTTVYVQAVDSAGNLSAETPYSLYLPWYPGAKVTPGDVNGDGIPDLVTTTPDGSLVEYPGDSDTSAPPVTLSTPAQSPDNTSPWTDYQYTHEGSYTQQAVDDLWALNTTTHNLYLYRNNGSTTGDNYNDTGNVTKPITKAEAATDAAGDPTGDSDGTSACYATATYPNACTSTSYDNTDWNQTTQIIASPDLYANSPTRTLDNNSPGLLTVENGSLWYYQGQGTPFYIGTAVMLGNGGWNAYTVMSPVTVNGQLVLWARNNTTGALYQYPVDYDANGYPYLGTRTQFTLPGTPDLTQTTYPQLYAQVLHATSTTSYPDLLAQNTAGQVIDYPGTAPTAQGLATFANPQTLGSASHSWTLTDATGTTAHDSIGTDNLTLQGGATWTTNTPQPHPAALALDGSTGGATATEPAIDTAGSYTISAWADPTTVTIGQDEVVASICDTNHCAAYLEINGNGDWELAAAGSNASTAGFYSTNTGSAATNTWTHIVGVFNAATSTMTLYINGVETGTTSYTPWAASGPFTIGADAWPGSTPGGWFTGSISDVTTYYYALNATQVTALYNQTN